MKHSNLASKVLVLVLLILGTILGNISMVFGQGAIESVRGAVVDADTGNPLPGNMPPFAFVRLLHCQEYGCFEVNSQPPDFEGWFVFNTDFSGQPLEAGTYQIVASASGYQDARTDPFDVGEGMTHVLGNIPLRGPTVIGSIGGRVIDAVTGNPLPGFVAPFALVQLLRCDEYGCLYVGAQPTDLEGGFLFVGQPLEVGTYQVAASANGYQQGLTDPFEVGQGEDLDVGDILLQPPVLIGSISGRVVDAVTGNPLPGNTDPFTFVRLLRCQEFGCFDVGYQPTDFEGRFQFNPSFSWQPLEVGTYQVVASANEYQQGQTDRFDVGEGEHREVGEVPLQPFPFGISEIRPCGDLPPEGGTCGYSVRVTNRLGTALDGSAWSLVSGMMIGSNIGFTAFQTANPQRLTLAPGASKVVRFDFDVPNTVRDGAYICTQVFVGQDRNQPFFNTVGQKSLFCITKGFTGAFSIVPENEAQNMFRQMNGPTTTPSNGR